MSQDVLQQARDKLLVEIGWCMVDVMKSLNRKKTARSLAETTAAFDDLQSTGGKIGRSIVVGPASGAATSIHVVQPVVER